MAWRSRPRWVDWLSKPSASSLSPAPQASTPRSIRRAPRLLVSMHAPNDLDRTQASSGSSTPPSRAPGEVELVEMTIIISETVRRGHPTPDRAPPVRRDARSCRPSPRCASSRALRSRRFCACAALASGFSMPTTRTGARNSQTPSRAPVTGAGTDRIWPASAMRGCGWTGSPMWFRLKRSCMTYQLSLRTGSSRRFLLPFQSSMINPRHPPCLFRSRAHAPG